MEPNDSGSDGIPAMQAILASSRNERSYWMAMGCARKESRNKPVSNERDFNYTVTLAVQCMYVLYTQPCNDSLGVYAELGKKCDVERGASISGYLILPAIES